MNRALLSLGLLSTFCTVLIAKPAYAEAEPSSCSIVNLRFDQNMRLYDFAVIEPDFPYITQVLGYLREANSFQPAIQEQQEFRTTQKGYGLKSVYTTDKTLEVRQVEGQFEFTGTTQRKGWTEKWKLVTDMFRPISFTRTIEYPSGEKATLVCNKLFRGHGWFVTPFSDSILPDYPRIPAVTTRSTKGDMPQEEANPNNGSLEVETSAPRGAPAK